MSNSGTPGPGACAAEVVELWEDGAGRLSIHLEGAAVVYEVVSERSTFERDLDVLLQGEADRIPGWWQARHWNEHADLVASDDGPRLVALWDCGQVLPLDPAHHPFGMSPRRAARRYLGLL